MTISNQEILNINRWLIAPTGYRLREPIEIEYFKGKEYDKRWNEKEPPVVVAFASAWWLPSGCQMKKGRGRTHKEASDDLVKQFIDEHAETAHWVTPAILFERVIEVTTCEKNQR